jgi:hypothetical protein
VGDISWATFRYIKTLPIRYRHKHPKRVFHYMKALERLVRVGGCDVNDWRFRYITSRLHPINYRVLNLPRLGKFLNFEYPTAFSTCRGWVSLWTSNILLSAKPVWVINLPRLGESLIHYQLWILHQAVNFEFCIWYHATVFEFSI